MPQLVVPETGASLHGAPDVEQASSLQGSKRAQVMQLNVPEAILDELVKSARGGKTATNISIQFGKSPTLHYGSKSRMVDSTPEKFIHELYTASTSDGSNRLSFAGILTHKLVVRMPERTATDGVDSAVLELQSKMAALENEKQSKTSIYVKDGSKLPPARRIRAHEVNRNSTQLLNKGRSSLFPNSIARSSTTSPASRSPSLMPATSAPTSAPTSQQLKAPRIEALRTPLIHLLALRPTTLKHLSRKTGCSVEDCKSLLQKVGKEARSGNGSWELTDRTYKELDVWNFRYPSESDRKSAIDNAISAFDRLRLGREDKLWQLLLPRKERGKGKFLSKLGAARKAETPSKPQDSIEDAADSHTMPTSRVGTDGEEMAKPTPQQQATKKKVSEREAVAKRLLSKNPSKKVKAPVKVAPKKITKSTKKSETGAAASKIKSAEFVEDSDSDIEMENAPPTTSTNAARVQSEKASTSSSAPPASSKLLKAQVNPKTLSSRPIKDDVKTSNPTPQAANSKSTQRSSKDKPKVTKLSPPSTKPSPQSIKTSPQATPKLPPQQFSKPLPQQKIASPRPSLKERLDNSPRKPSPLGASPPENASDFDSAPSIPSTLSSPSGSQGSKGQSTPTPGPIKKYIENHTNGDRLLAPTAKPVPNPSQSTPRSKQALKRKADEIDPHDTSRQSDTNQRSEGRGNKRHQTEASPPSISESSESPPPHDYYTIERARRFKSIHRRYERLYQEISLMPVGGEPPADKIKELTNMHSKLKSLKVEISRGSQA
ncbi:hypothetical protein FGG08_003440 [Glutinoglossum americanum]|uniref:Uncharacterized protein n=1 Tax=Glutinoglossum americanum TaxID=1670608 RepID=A0A9P8L4R8_9PEZI|nr:hypothetical protein FGG08_003440 [Glutinoglossum americanum]